MAVARTSPAPASRAPERAPVPALHVVAPPRRARRRRDLVERRRLTRRLTTSSAPLALLVAPAGYGKTVALEAWAERDERPFAWVRATRADDDPEHLLASLARALADATPASVDALRPESILAVDALTRLSDAVRAAPRPMVLVIDDAQAIRAAAAFAVLAALVEHLPPGATIALASRREPGLPLGRLRVEGRVLELRAGELAMTGPEAAGLLHRAGPAPPADLVRQAEGWPAALALAGREDLVDGYVHDVVLSPLRAGARAFLAAVSPLETLSGPLCDAVTGRRGSGARLRELARDGVPLSPLDGCDERFRLHPLVAAALRTELRETDPAAEAEGHRRASAWYEEAGDAEAAVEHALAGEDRKRLGRLVWELASTRRPAPGAGPAERQGHGLAAAHAAATPELALTLALGHAEARDGDEAERWTAIAERSLDGAGSRPDLLAGAAAVRAAVGRHGVTAMAADAARARALAPAGSTWYAIACHLEGTARHLLGDPDLARLRLEEGARVAADAAPLTHVLCLSQLALLSLLGGGDGAEASGWAEAAVRIADRGAGEDPRYALAFAVSALALARSGRVGDARTAATTAERLAVHGDAAPWYAAEVRIALALTELRLSDAVAARVHLDRAARSLRAIPEAVLAARWIGEGAACAAAFAGDDEIALGSLTTAELRVLRLLPSHRSFREIAGLLTVSANTVKTQAHGVYRKLGASSRFEAVARARDVGLVDA